MEVISQAELSRPSLASELYDRHALELRAVQLIESRQGIEHDRWQREPEINARTAIFEELTAKGHLSSIRFEEPAELTNQRALQRLLNGWSDNLPVWEQQRRFSEIVEELTIHAVWADIAEGRMAADTMIITISDFPEIANGPQAVKFGYRDLNKKGMARATFFENGRRVVEQVSRSNSNDGSSEWFFGTRGFAMDGSSVRALSSQLVATRRDFADGVVDVQRSLDSWAGPQIIYGERRHPGLNVPEYEDLRAISATREHQAEGFIKLLADYERQINIDYQKGLMTYDQKLAAINRRRQDLVTEICVLDPSYAHDARGQAAVIHFEKAASAMAAGNDDAGAMHLQRAIEATDPAAGVVCGGSGQTANQSSEGAGAAKRLYEEAKQQRKNWKWQRGVCVVSECPPKPNKTEIGPCSVCRKCQDIYDDGGEPNKIYRTKEGIIDLIFKSIEEVNHEYNIRHQQKATRKLIDQAETNNNKRQSKNS